ncbi:class I SAM-dependent methyltransferase [Actinomyces bowdenii]|uniref:Class I SAM-dependent methyltransferase n=1 Tax=Actinomyces bowdenii TaxID=131109 RepID=A0A853EGJ3_9ACTO|nr:class I SAM-dependent methyltransferase [Actinomyces bowdenii]MBF0696295.1 class I SAM-dependent methyltransferase [Actinomyces bowdenii]NYS68468.1 class I SAM-dependent methyltransferase [Actinomyces bowdenii]
MTTSRAAHWEARYASVDRLWSGRPNDWLPELAGDWEPGAGLDIGCGEGADTLWLAERGWRVTAVDLSPTAIDRLRREAARRGLDQQVSALVQDGGQSLPEGPFDLVTCFYVHGGPKEGGLRLGDLLADAAGRVAPGGHLLVAVHAINPPWHTHHARTYTAAELLEEIGESVAGWQTVVAEERWREATGPQGQAGRRADAVLCLRRPGSRPAGEGGATARAVGVESAASAVPAEPEARAHPGEPGEAAPSGPA